MVGRSLRQRPLRSLGMDPHKRSAPIEVIDEHGRVLGAAGFGADHGSTLTELDGIGPAGAARLLADVGDIHRFRDRDRFASWNGTAPLDASSDEQVRHRLSHAGNRRINRTLHIMAIVQLRNPTEGRTYYDTKKTAGTTSTEAMRALKRRLSNVVYQRMLADQ
jgi:transposase